MSLNTLNTLTNNAVRERRRAQEVVEAANEAYRQWMASLSQALGEHWRPAEGREMAMGEVERCIKDLVARFEARGNIIDALTAGPGLTGRAAGEGEQPPDILKPGDTVRLPDGRVATVADVEYVEYDPPDDDPECDGGECQSADGHREAGVVPGLGKDAPTVTNEAGGKQSHLPYRCDLLPALATLAVCGVIQYGSAKYGDDNWKAIPVASHLNHMLAHVFAHLAGDRQDDHLEHAATRALFALQLALEAKRKGAA